MTTPIRMPAHRAQSGNLGPDRVLRHPKRWLALVAFGMGFTTWAAFLYIGLRAQRRAWLMWAAAYGALALIGLVADGTSHANSPAADGGTTVLMVAWLGGIVHSAVVRREAAGQARPSRTNSLGEARQRIERRAEGRRLAARDPRLAKEVGVGRPDIPGAEDYGLIDVNHASPGALCRLPGVTPEIARRITETREGIGLFKSADELGIYLDLSPAFIDDIRDYSVFL
jgi:DNA uptake protein ComE-like DNA-binding protein